MAINVEDANAVMICAQYAASVQRLPSPLD
jgi:hypothetical protein